MDKRFRDAEEALAHFLESAAAGAEIDFEAYCASLPEFAAEMRAQFALIEAQQHSRERGRAGAGGVASLAEVAPEIADSLRRVRTRVGIDERYELGDEIGSGAMGVVYRAFDRTLKRHVALKRMRGWRSGTHGSRPSNAEPRSIGRFLQEAQIIAQLHHPGIVPVYDVGTDDADDLFFTMLLVEGRDLSKVLVEYRRGEGGWTLERLVALLLDVCETVAYAHSKGLLHRDLKPSNVRIGAFNAVHVLDWGLARVLEEPLAAKRASALKTDRPQDRETGSSVVTQAGDVVGTPSYMAPEQALGAPPSEASDVYALGAMLYELLTGRAPYTKPGERITAAAVLARLASDPPESIDALAPRADAELADICRKAMHRDSRRRYASASALAEDLRAYLEGRVVSAHHGDVTTALRKWIARNKALSSTVAAALLVLAGMLVAFVWRLEREVDATKLALEERDLRTRERNRHDHRLRADELIAKADELFPAREERIDDYVGWLREADELLAERATHESDRNRTDADTARLVEGVLASFTALQARRSDVAERLERARTFEKRWRADRESEWDAALVAIAESDEYVDNDGFPLELEPQRGLVPLGINPQSNLAEFFLLDSGDPPLERNDATGHWSFGLNTGIVLVLVPPLRGHPGALHAFFVGKYEVTQGQWRRLMGSNPSDRCSDRPDPKYPGPWRFDDRHPIENVTWLEAHRFAGRLGVRLMSKREWVRFAGGRAESPRWTGADDSSLFRRENVKYDPDDTGVDHADDFPFHAPVGSFEANDFGGFDLLGNVAELCRDELPGRDDADPTALRLLATGDHHTDELAMSSTATTQAMRADWKNFSTGLRVSLPVERCPACGRSGVVEPNCAE